jgi:hypothetical protein
LSYKRQAADTLGQLECPGTGLLLGFPAIRLFCLPAETVLTAMFYTRTFFELFSSKTRKWTEKPLREHNQNTPGHLLQTVYGTILGNFRVFAKIF